jgi:hypothetical protein
MPMIDSDRGSLLKPTAWVFIQTCIMTKVCVVYQRCNILDHSTLSSEIAGIKAKQALGANTTVVSMPFSAAITPDVSKKAILSLVNQVNTNIFDGLSERQLIVLYIALHWITGLVQLEGLESTMYAV